MRLPVHGLGLAAALLLLPAALPAQTAAPAPRPLLRPGIESAARAALDAGDYDSLETTEAAMRAEKRRLADGSWQLPVFYEAVSDPAHASEEEWTAQFQKLASWREAKPDSAPAAVAEAKAWTGYAWFARGTGWASSVTEDGWRLFRERLAKARSVLEEWDKAHPDGDLTPEFYRAMQTVALGQQWGHPEYAAWFDRAVQAAPDYDPLYLAKAYFLLPRWYGAPGEWEAFAWDAGHRRGAELYVRICGAQRRFFDAGEFFAADRSRWPFLREGYEKIEAAAPPLTRYQLNEFAYFACAAGDKATARKLLGQIGEQPDLHVWGDAGAFQKARARAFSALPSLSLPPLGKAAWAGVALAAMGIQAGLLALLVFLGRRRPKKSA